EGRILVDPAAHFRNPYFSSCVGVDTKESVLDRDSQSDDASRQAHGFTECGINLSEIAAKHGLPVFHLFVRFARFTSAEYGHSEAVTKLGQPCAELVSFLPG